MQFYHGSRNGNLTELSIKKSKDGKIWMTDDYNFAVMYGASSIRSWKWYNNKLIIMELYKDDAFETQFKNKPFYIYTTEDVNDYEVNIAEKESIKKPLYTTTHNVKLIHKEFIPDAYAKIMELYNKGEIELFFWKDRVKGYPESSEKNKQLFIDGIKQMLDEGDYEKKYPEDYALSKALFPEVFEEYEKGLNNK